ncbi:MAG: hypothetical protein ISS15_06825 [Alphaproteobacteria bacterium]|nr:hypothetical protein [Alphaproteobacteria bacterium]MBL6938295.1 hypothetical protein [Alphaproteobacteria bacterium]MBL7097351.1 hypothetical protein [Alphaproteobacteria bacterium]
MMNLLKGMVSGFGATVLLSLLMLMKQQMGMMPQMDVIAMLTQMSGSTNLLIGWAMHFMIGTVIWGGLFGLFQNWLPGGTPLVRGIAFGIGAWLLMMAMVMPMTGAGFFGLKFGMAAPVITLMLHVVFGATMGLLFRAQQATAPA